MPFPAVQEQVGRSNMDRQAARIADIDSIGLVGIGNTDPAAGSTGRSNCTCLAVDPTAAVDSTVAVAAAAGARPIRPAAVAVGAAVVAGTEVGVAVVAAKMTAVAEAAAVAAAPSFAGVAAVTAAAKNYSAVAAAATFDFLQLKRYVDTQLEL